MTAVAAENDIDEESQQVQPIATLDFCPNKKVTPKKEVFLTVALDEVKLPVLQFFAIWAVLSAIFIVAGYYDVNALGYALLLGSLCSIIGTCMILFSGYMAHHSQRQVS